MGARLRIGLTGGIASGKSTVAQRLTELGVPVIDADESARGVVAPGTPGLRAVMESFGAGILNPDGSLDRRAMRELIFAEPQRRSELERILHPLIRDDMDQRAAAAVGPYVVLAIPLLIESGKFDRVDRILVVDIDEALQLQRLMARDPGTVEQARTIIAAQADRATRLKFADDVLHNSGTVSDLRHRVDAIHGRYVSLSEAWHSGEH